LREIFVTEIVKEVLGPRDGAFEVLNDSPLSEYITGVLSPITETPSVPDIESEADLPAEETEETEESVVEPEILIPLSASILDPKVRPHSIGLSFILESSDTPAFDICITWAIYKKRNSRWERHPRHAFLTYTGTSGGDYWLDSNGNQVTRKDAEISLHLRIEPRTDGEFLVRIYLVNRIPVPQGERVREEHHIFQPQIRICLKDGTRLIPGLEGSPQNEQERRLQFLYRNRQVLVRGHSCSAVWRDIDPERQYSNTALDFPEALQEPPFQWVDGDLLPPETRQRFSPPDVRTEFVPLYPVESPFFEFPADYGNPPETRAEILAELWNPEELRSALQPFVDGYRRWINDLETQVNLLPEQDRDLARRLIEECKRVCNRIQRGIELLINDDNVRLAFCFAMKAIAIQHTWPVGSSRPPFELRPFQLAFILMVLESIVNPASADRNICDLLWVPTGAGKTEAYLALVAFTIAYRRRRNLMKPIGQRRNAGVTVISRYTLRLLTVQQFRRALKLITACEYLRVWDLKSGNPVGWRPSTCRIRNNFIWGSSRFSVGLWVGGKVTPNRLKDTWGGGRTIHGALSILRGERGEGEPAQVLNCPACNSVLSIPQTGGLSPGTYTLHLIMEGDAPSNITSTLLSKDQITVNSFNITRLQSGCFILTVNFSSDYRITAEDINRWWHEILQNVFNNQVRLMCANSSRPGYFIRWYLGSRNQEVPYDFEIFCPNPECPLHNPWCEGRPLGWICETAPRPELASDPEIGFFPDGNSPIRINRAFKTNSKYISDRIPIPAYTVDEQVYHHCPSIVISTVDKFARLPFEPKASSLFGNVEYYHCIWGYYRRYQRSSNQDADGHPGPAGTRTSRNYCKVPPFDPPELIIQDELHLIEGPLGSLVGIYETAVDFLCSEALGKPIKYIASTATIRQAQEQVQSVFCRGVQIFPPPGLTRDDSFFIRHSENHPLDDRRPGQLYLGICAPGRGPLTPVLRIWARLLNTAWQNRRREIDSFWTLTGYFNAIRELAGVRALYRQDIPERLQRISGGDSRPLPEDRAQELSSRVPSTELPIILDLLNNPYPNANAQDALFTTSMFGTGIDIPRIGLMVVHGQPKTTSSYIQATGRVGRSRGALIITFLRATRPRDLAHYEFFCGYHRQLHRFVEPVTVMPFASGVLERACGPVMVAILRNRRNANIRWHKDDTASQMATARRSSHVLETLQELESRAHRQPPTRAPPRNYVYERASADLDRWHQVASRTQGNLRYVEYAINTPPSHNVVLGDPQHQYERRFEVVYENVPHSLRDIEETCGFQI